MKDISELAPESSEEIEEPIVVPDGPQDIDPTEWLAGEREAAGVTGYVVMDGRRLKIAPITEGEDNQLLKASRRPDKQGKIGPDFLLYRRLYIAKSLNKANPAKAISHDDLIVARSGYLSRLQKAIQEISGQEFQGASDPLGSST
jgi:hypothetical protein